MHQQNIIYRDLKLENILLDMDGHIRLSDFGLSYKLKNSSERIYSMSGTAGYLAPETLEQTGHGRSVDIWAFGILMFIILVKESPFYLDTTLLLSAMLWDLARQLLEVVLTPDLIVIGGLTLDNVIAADGQVRVWRCSDGQQMTTAYGTGGQTAIQNYLHDVTSLRTKAHTL